MPKRTFWLATGVALGAGSSLWAERKVRRSVQQAAARLQPDTVVAEVGRSARQVAGTAGEPGAGRRGTGRDEMLRREEELWAELAAQGVDVDPPGAQSAAVTHPDPTHRMSPTPSTPMGAQSTRRSRSARRLRAKSPSHLDK